MRFLDFLFSKTKSIEIEDDFFGKLRFLSSKDVSKNYFTGKRYFKPINKPIELIIEQEETTPSQAQKQFFQRIEEEYSRLIDKMKPLITDEFQNWRPDFQITDFEQEFTPVHLMIPRLNQKEYTWDIAFETVHDENHHVTITFKGLNPIEILIDG
jgi:hypothetical protein